MNYIKGCLLLPLCALCVYAVTDGQNDDQMTAEVAKQFRTCESRCRLRLRRSCSTTPPFCGDCLAGFRERDGLCLAEQPAGSSWIEKPDEDVDRLALAARLEREEQSLSDESADEDSKVGVKGTAPRYTIQKIHHTPHQRHKDKLEQVNDILMSEEEEEPTTEEPPPGDTPAPPGDTPAPPGDAPVALPFYAKPKHSPRIGSEASMADIYFIVVVAGCSVAGLVGLVVAGFCWYRIQKDVKATSEAEYPAYGVTGPVKGHPSPPGDRKLAQSAQMYHYQHQKQQMLALEKAQGMMNKDGSDVDSDEENEEGDYTVYECPGLAPTGEMEVNNPLFGNDAAPAPPTGEEKSTPQSAQKK